jgi:hypothetical protein
MFPFKEKTFFSMDEYTCRNSRTREKLFMSNFKGKYIKTIFPKRLKIPKLKKSKGYIQYFRLALSIERSFKKIMVTEA